MSIDFVDLHVPVSMIAIVTWSHYRSKTISISTIFFVGTHTLLGYTGLQEHIILEEETLFFHVACKHWNNLFTVSNHGNV